VHLGKVEGVGLSKEEVHLNMVVKKLAMEVVNLWVAVEVVDLWVALEGLVAFWDLEVT
jgi:hypothetical protein